MRLRYFLPPAAILAFVGATAASACLNDPGLVAASSVNPPLPPQPTVKLAVSKSILAEGKELFIENCSTCHGSEAEGSARAPNLQGLGAATIDFWIATGRMPLAYPTAQAAEKPSIFTAAQRHAIVAWVTSLAPGGPGIPRVNLKGANVAEGNEIFSLNCAGCHTITGAGDALANGYYAPSLFPATATEIAEAVRTGPGNMPRFSTAQISPSQLDDVVAYVKEYIQHPKDIGGLGLGHVGPVAEGFVGLALGVGSLMVVSYWIGDRVERRRPRRSGGHVSSDGEGTNG